MPRWGRRLLSARHHAAMAVFIVTVVAMAGMDVALIAKVGVMVKEYAVGGQSAKEGGRWLTPPAWPPYNDEKEDKQKEPTKKTVYD